MNSNRKGKRYERLAASLLEDLGYSARRSQQYQGVRVEGAGDLQTSLDGVVRFEIKGGYNDTNLTSAKVKNWTKTAKEETPKGTAWLILWKKSRMDWVAICPFGSGYAAITDIKYAIEYAKSLSTNNPYPD